VSASWAEMPLSLRCLLLVGAKFVAVIVVLIAVIELVVSGYSVQNFWELLTLSGLVTAQRMSRRSSAVSRRSRRRR